MNKNEVVSLMQSIHFFNEQFHFSENIDYLSNYHELMRVSKNRSQLMLLKFATPELVWIKRDLNSLNQEWLLGMYDFSDNYAFHIPLHVLQKNLSEELLITWNIL